jgi:hypothetical protein
MPDVQVVATLPNRRGVILIRALGVLTNLIAIGVMSLIMASEDLFVDQLRLTLWVVAGVYIATLICQRRGHCRNFALDSLTLKVLLETRAMKVLNWTVEVLTLAFGLMVPAYRWTMGLAGLMILFMALQKPFERWLASRA